ncbi:hypothetical protein Tco_0965461 [Tanacetum coccineum]
MLRTKNLILKFSKDSILQLESYKKILLKLNLSDHRQIKDGGGGPVIPAAHKILKPQLIPDRTNIKTS